MHWTRAVQMLGHEIYAVVRKLIRTRYEAHERAPTSVQIPKNSYKNSLSSTFVITSLWPAHQTRFVILTHHLEVGEIWTAQSVLLASTLQKPQQPIPQLPGPSWHAGRETRPLSMAVVTQSWSEHNWRGLWEKPKYVVRELANSVLPNLLCGAGWRKTLLSQSTTAHSCYLILTSFARRQTIP